MKDKLLVSVGQGDIDDGVSFSANTCPVALAVKRTIPWTFSTSRPEITVTTRHILVDEVVYHVPRSVAKFVRDFDRYPHVTKVIPFKFWLRRNDEFRT